MSLGILPDDEQMVFKAVQTYDSGEVVSWIEEAAEGAEEPEHPAPILELTAPQAEDTSTVTGVGDTAPVAATSNDDNMGTWLGGAALVVALATAGLAGLSLRRRTSA